VAHHEVLVSRHRDRAEVAVGAASAFAGERLSLKHAVADDVTVADRYAVARDADDALDEVLVRARRRRSRAGDAALGAVVERALAGDPALVRVGALRRVEDEYVPHLRIAEVVPYAVDEHALADREGRLHRAARDPVRLDDERLDPERKAEGDGHDEDQLQQRAGGGLRLAPHVLLGVGGLRLVRASGPVPRGPGRRPSPRA